MSNPDRQFAGCSRDIFHRNTEEDESPFCTQENWQGSVIFLNQEVELMGLQASLHFILNSKKTSLKQNYDTQI